MRIIVTGSKGQLGSEFQELAKSSELDFIFTDYQDLDITNINDVLAFFKNANPDFCINCAAYTAVDKAESDKELADQINVQGSLNLAMGCQVVSAKLIHISTDFVFDGSASSPLTEGLPVKPINYYGESKLNGELAIAKALDQHIIIRTSWLYSVYGNNFVKSMLNLAKTRDELHIISDQIGTPTYAKDLAKTILKIISSDPKDYGVFHYSNEGVASWYDFTMAVFEYSNTSCKVHPIPTSQYPTPAARPAYSVMDKAKIKATYKLEIPYWRASLKECIANLIND